ncbi:alkylmercury lyase family protein [Nocardia sp. NPDC050406]|uniref:alkylmercury lyase family protein n=1 Tax=Nocardia sp. NPDC050406 TaxID=3364318 RepID=UPI0037AFC364
MAELPTRARDIRSAIMEQVRNKGSAPTRAELRDRFQLSDEELAADLRALEGAICVACQDEEHADSPVFQDEPLSTPQPPLGELVYARPFATFANHYRVTVDGQQSWFAECAVEACAISGQFPGSDVVVDSVCRQTGQPVRLVGRDGVLLDYSPKTLRVHLGYPMREMPRRVVGWCDFNSFFASEEAAEQWHREHPTIKGVTRSPEQMSRLITELLGKGRLDYDYQPDFPLLVIARNLRRFGLVGVRRGRLPRPDTFWLPTLAMVRDWRRRGLGYYFRFHLR